MDLKLSCKLVWTGSHLTYQFMKRTECDLNRNFNLLLTIEINEYLGQELKEKWTSSDLIYKKLNYLSIRKIYTLMNPTDSYSKWNWTSFIEFTYISKTFWTGLILDCSKKELM